MLKNQGKISNESSKEKKSLAKWWTIFGIGIGVFIFALDVYIVNLALPIMVESFHTSFATIQWVVLSYLLAIAIFVLTVSKLGDMWSKKQLYLIGLIVFTISSLFCGIAPNIEFLIAFRGFQGLGAAFLSGLGTAMIVEAFPGEERGLGLGIRAGIYGLGITLGPTVGGWLISLGDWPLIFLINVPIGIVGILIVARFVPDSDICGTKQSFDLFGTVLLTIALTSLILVITLLQNGSFDTALNLLVVSAITSLVFFWLESQITAPIIPFKIFQSLDFSLGLILRFLANFAIAGVIFILPFFLALVERYPTEKAGILMAIPSIVIVVTAPISGILSDRFGTRIITLIGLVLMAIGCFAIGNFDTELTVIHYVFAVIPYGIGVAMFQSPNNSSIMGAAPKDQLGIASGLLSFSRIVGQTIGVPMVGALFFFVTTANSDIVAKIDIINAPIKALLLGTHTTFSVIGVFLIISTMLATLFWWMDKGNKIKIRLT
ncbi:multidrug MFS transporter [Oscillatoriales cyanobacterium USR001]|nr:multidrug MFS transporter [Oscillatoriales cyanobacterium USR001]